VRNADDGEFWWRINLNRHAQTVRAPMLHITSWYDIFLEGGLNAYRSIKDKSVYPQARNGQKLIVGPWAHLLPYVVPNSRGSGDADFGPESLVDFHQTQLRWFDYWLRDVDTGIMAEPPVSVFTMGEDRWQGLADWPPPNANYVRFYFHSGGKANSLHGDGSLSTVPPGDEPADAFTYDPNDPVPTYGGRNLSIPLGVQDQRPVEYRGDVLVFTSEPLERAMEVTGPISVELWAASSARDTDFTAKLVDVRPDGYAANLADGVIRARYRDSSSDPTLLQPGRPYRYTIDLWATSNVFLPGHRIRVEISSTNFPRFDRNPNTGAAFGADAALVKAQQTVFHRSDMSSSIVLPLIPR
jgi:putative CocE/NonD family hydrolase